MIITIITINYYYYDNQYITLVVYRISALVTCIALAH